MSPPVKQFIKPDIAARAMTAIRACQAGQHTGLICPICAAPGLEIMDRSARPHMAWYVLNCKACGLDEAVAVPAGAHTGKHDG